MLFSTFFLYLPFFSLILAPTYSIRSKTGVFQQSSLIKIIMWLCWIVRTQTDLCAALNAKIEFSSLLFYISCNFSILAI